MSFDTELQEKINARMHALITNGGQNAAYKAVVIYIHDYAKINELVEIRNLIDKVIPKML